MVSPECAGREPWTVARLAWEWLATYVATARNAKGRRLAATRVARYLVPELGARSLGDLRGDDVRRYRLALEAGGLSALTVTHVLSDLRAMLHWAVAEQRLDRTPFPRRVLPRVPEQAPRGFSDADLERLLALPGRRGFVLRFLIGTGLRWAEACRARREDVVDDLLLVSRSKSGRMRRVPLTAAILPAVRACEGRLVPYAEGSPGSFARGVRRASGVADFHVHRCRHTFAMRWLAAGGNLAVLQQVLGHRDLATTLRYARVSDELVRRESRRLEGWLWADGIPR